MKAFKLSLMTAGAAVMFLAHSTAQAQQYRPPIFDSTGVHTGVTATLVLPVMPSSPTNIQTSPDLPPTNGNTGIPPGYTEVATPMGNRSLGSGDAGLALAAYYYALGYPSVAVPSSAYMDCRGYTGSGEILTTPGPPVCTTGDANSCAGVGPTVYAVCEPQGTRYELHKVIGSTVVTFAQPQLNVSVLPNTVGLSTQTATPFCQTRGYTNYVPGSVNSTQPFDCGSQITRWNGTAFYSDNACYNPVMHSLQCWK